MVKFDMGKCLKPLSIKPFRKSSASSEQIYECIFLLCHKKALLRFQKGAWRKTVFNQGLGLPTSDNYHSVHAHLSVNTLKHVRLMCPRGPNSG